MSLGLHTKRRPYYTRIRMLTYSSLAYVYPLALL